MGPNLESSKIDIKRKNTHGCVVQHFNSAGEAAYTLMMPSNEDIDKTHENSGRVTDRVELKDKKKYVFGAHYQVSFDFKVGEDFKHVPGSKLIIGQRKQNIGRSKSTPSPIYSSKSTQKNMMIGFYN